MFPNSKYKLIASCLSPRGQFGKLAVFCFHQALRNKDPFRPGEPDAEEFTQDVARIAHTFNVLSVGDAAQKMRERSLPAAAACISFDDGYADNHEIAAPILESIGVPATFFIAGSAVDDGVMWNDLIINTIAEVGNDAAFDELPIATNEIRQREYDASSVGRILHELKYIPLQERLDCSRKFFVTSTGSRPPRLMMRRQDVADLARRGFEIGGHTINHPILSKVSENEALSEIESCYEWVSDVTGVSPRSFAYPNGIPGTDFSPLHENMVRDAGFGCGVSTHWSVANKDSNPFCIPRVGPWWRQGRGFYSGLGRTYLSSMLSR